MCGLSMRLAVLYTCALHFCAAAQAEHEVQRGFFLNVVVGERPAVFHLLAGEDEALLVRRDALLVLDLALDHLDGVRGLDLERDRLAGERLDENLHAGVARILNTDARECELVEHLDRRRAAVAGVEEVLLAVRHVDAVGDVLLGGGVHVLAVERDEQRRRDEHEREEEPAEEHAVPGDPQQRVVDDGAARRVAAEVRLLDELDRRDEVHAPARVRLDLVAERGVVLHVGVEVRALALLHEPLLVMAALLLDDERLGVELHARDDEAEAPEGEREHRHVAERVGDEPRVSPHPEHVCALSVTNMRTTDFRNQRFFSNSINDVLIPGMSGKGRGRKKSRGQDDENDEPNRSSSQASRAGSTTSKKGHHKKDKDAGKDGKKQKPKTNAQNEDKPMTKREVAKLFAQMWKGGRATPHNDLDPDVRMHNRANDVNVAKKDIVRNDYVYSQRFNKNDPWSNYPYALPPRFTKHIVHGVRKALLGVNDDRRLAYYGNTWELGALDCYEGVSENNQANFLSCDLVNPVYLKQISKYNLRGRNNPKSSAQEWLYGSSCFVYAPPDTLLACVHDNNTYPIPLNTAKARWSEFARNEETIPGTASPLEKKEGGVEEDGPQVHPHFWCYHEEFIDFENRDKNHVHPKFDPVKYKGRIGFFFPIMPVEPGDEDALSYFDEADDRIGWGVITRMGQELDPEWIPTTWKETQARIGRYILLTNVWSCNEQTDPYEVHVNDGVLLAIYKKVCQMTKGDMFVSVRRGCHGYDRLCVLQKNITIEPGDERFGFEDKYKTAAKSDLYVTQILTCCQAQTKNLERKPMVEVWKSKSISYEEKNLCSIFQNFNNSVIACMKNDGYREVMIDFWKQPKNRLASMPGRGEPPEWTPENMRKIMVVMFSTSYELIFERAASKVACPDRLFRLSAILTNYRDWFEHSKCMADKPFVKDYEEKQKKNQVDLSSFTGMLSKYTATSKGTFQDNDQVPPDFDRPDPKVILTKLPPAGAAPSIKVQSAEEKAEVERQRVNRKIYENVFNSMGAILHKFIAEDVTAQSAPTTVLKYYTDSKLSLVAVYRRRLTVQVYEEMLQHLEDHTVNFGTVFQQAFDKLCASENISDKQWLEAEKNLVLSK